MSGVRGDTRRYRALHLLEQMQLLGIGCDFVHQTDIRYTKELSPEIKFAFFHRVPYDDHIGRLIENLKSRKALVISDFDDLIFDPNMFSYINSPDFSDVKRASLYVSNMRNLQITLERSNAVTVTTEYLKLVANELGKKVWVHRNAFSQEMGLLSSRAYHKDSEKNTHNKKVVIGYASGTPTHNRDFKMICPALREILRNNPKVELWLIGPLNPGNDWGKLNKQIRQFSLVPWRRLPELLVQFDINLAPLVANNPFSQSKSEIKYLEAGLVGVPTVASPSDAYSFSIHQGRNGFLAQTSEEWIEIISQLISDPGLRKAVGEHARETITKEYHPITRAAQLADTLERMYLELSGTSFWRENKPQLENIKEVAKKPNAKGRRISARYENDPSLLKLGFYALRYSGLKATIIQIWILFRRSISLIFPFRTDN